MQPQTLYTYAKPPQTAYMMAYCEYMADPAHKALIKALPPITLPDGWSTVNMQRTILLGQVDGVKLMPSKVDW